MNILITGANGFLGQHLTAYFSATKHAVFTSSRGECRIPEKYTHQYFPAELTAPEQVRSLIKTVQPDVIIHTAAMSKPDECNEYKERCLLHNVESVRYLLASCKDDNPNTSFLFTSTDYIFGENGPHSEEDIPNPLNFYGESKLMAEQLIKGSGLSFAIIRPVFIYGPVWDGLRPSFLHWVKNNLEAGKSIKVVTDQSRTPTYVYDICNGMDAIINDKKVGAFHLAGKDILSPYQMAVKTAQALHLDETLIQPVTSDTFPEPVKRAKHSGLKIYKAMAELNYNPVSFEAGVKLSFP